MSGEHRVDVDIKLKKNAAVFMKTVSSLNQKHRIHRFQSVPELGDLLKQIKQEPSD